MPGQNMEGCAVLLQPDPAESDQRRRAFATISERISVMIYETGNLTPKSEIITLKTYFGLHPRQSLS